MVMATTSRALTRLGGAGDGMSNQRQKAPTAKAISNLARSSSMGHPAGRSGTMRAAIGCTKVFALGCLAVGREAIHDLVAGRHDQNEGCSRESQRCRKRQSSKTAHNSDTGGKEQSEQYLHSSLG
jgi:hypothetical protein